MKLTLAVLCSLIYSRLVAVKAKYYTDMYEYVDLDAILNNERLLNQYIACIMDKGSCTADGWSLKRILPDALATSCEKCSNQQKQMARKMSIYLKEHRPEAWLGFLEKYDPKNEYIASFEQFLEPKEE